ncbi:MAG: DUF899 domain-containing protein [Rhizomicrobium sp.]
MDHQIVSREEWIEARKALLAKEKEETHIRDDVNKTRLALPWVGVEKNYVFETPKGRKHLGDLFESRSQLIVYHFMLGPGWKAGCPGCSFLADHLDGALAHLNYHDVTLTAVSRGPLTEIEKYKARMGWKFPWISSHGSDFNFDFHVSFLKEARGKGATEYNYSDLPRRPDAEEGDTELPGLSAFYQDREGRIFHTYSSYARGPESLIGTLMILDRAPLGRNETGTMSFVRRHDEYDQPAQAGHG